MPERSQAEAKAEYGQRYKKMLLKWLLSFSLTIKNTNMELHSVLGAAYYFKDLFAYIIQLWIYIYNFINLKISEQSF